MYISILVEENIPWYNIEEQKRMKVIRNAEG